MSKYLNDGSGFHIYQVDNDITKPTNGSLTIRNVSGNTIDISSPSITGGTATFTDVYYKTSDYKKFDSNISYTDYTDYINLSISKKEVTSCTITSNTLQIGVPISLSVNVKYTLSLESTSTYYINSQDTSGKSYTSFGTTSADKNITYIVSFTPSKISYNNNNKITISGSSSSSQSVTQGFTNGVNNSITGQVAGLISIKNVNVSFNFQNLTIPRDAICIDGSYNTFILSNLGNQSASTESFTKASGISYFYLGLTDIKKWETFDIKNFVTVNDVASHEVIDNIKFDTTFDFYAKNLRYNTDYAYYSIPLNSDIMVRALAQIQNYTYGKLGIGTLKANEVLDSSILSNFNGTIDEYVNKLLANYSEYNKIGPAYGDINDGDYDSQLLMYPLPADSESRKSLEKEIVKQYSLNGQSNLLSCVPEYYNRDINFDFLKNIFKVDNASLYDSSGENELKQLTVMSYTIQRAEVEGLSMGSGTGDNTFVISEDKPVSWYIATVAAQPGGTFDEIKKVEPDKVLDYKSLYELRNVPAHDVNLFIKANNLTNTVDDFYFKDRIFAEGGSKTPSRVIENQWIHAQVSYDESSKECHISLNSDDIIQSDGSKEDLAGQDRSDKFRNGAGMFDIGNSKVVTNNYKEYELKDILSNLFIRRSGGNTSIYELYYNNGTEIAAEDINKEKGIISFKFFLYSFGFSWKKYDGNTEKCYANKLCFISEDDMNKNAGAVKYQFGITKDNIFYNDVKSKTVAADINYNYYTLTDIQAQAKIATEETKNYKEANIQNGEIGPFIEATKSAKVDNNIKYALSKNKRVDDDWNYIYDSFRSVTAFRPFVDGDMTSTLEYKNDICDTISLDKGFIHDYMLKYNEAYTVVKQIENGVETGNQLIIKAGDQNPNIVFAKAVPEKEFVEKQVLNNEDLKQIGADANQILEDIKGTINSYSRSILEAKVSYTSGNELLGLESTSTANNTYVVYKLYIDDTLEALDGEPDEKTVEPVRVDETEFTINIFPFDRDSRGNTVAGTQYIEYGAVEDVDGSVTKPESAPSNLLYSKKFTISSAKDEVDVYDEYLEYKGIMPILLNESLGSLSDFHNASPEYIAGLLADRNLSSKIFKNVQADGKYTEKQAYSAMSCMNVYSEESIKNQADYAKDVRTEDWWNISTNANTNNIYPIGYNGIKLTTSSNTTQNIYIGLEPNLIEKQLAIFAQSIYDYTWYLKATNNALIEVYPNETFTFEYIVDDENENKAYIDVVHTFGVSSAEKENKIKSTQYELKTVNSTDNEEDNIEGTLFEQIDVDKKNNPIPKKVFKRVANSGFIEREENDTNINNYIEDKAYSCLVLNRQNVSVSIETNGGWMLDPNAIVTKRDDDNYPISNKVYMSPELEFNDEDLYAEKDSLSKYIDPIQKLRKNHELYDNTDSSMLISVNYAAPTNKDYTNAINEKDKRYLGISYKLTYNVPVGVHFSEKFTGETTAVNYVNVANDLTADEWEYGDEEKGIKTIDLSAYTVNIPEKMEKTAYVFKYYFEPKYADIDENAIIFNYESNKVIKRNIDIQATFEPINYELYLSYLRAADKGERALDTINTELRTFTYEDTLVNFQKDDDGKFIENYLARLPATKSGSTVDDCFYKGHILSDGWYLLPEKTRINNVIIEDDEFLEKTFGPKSALCYCEPQTYNIYYIEKLPEVIDSNTKIQVIKKQEGISYNDSVTLLSGDENTSVHGYNELGRYHKVLFTEPFAEPDDNDVLSAADLGFANSDGTSVKYDPEAFFYGQTARNICGDFSFDEENKTARIPNVYLEYMYEINDQSIQIKYNDNVNTIKTFTISAVEGKNTDIISFINANNDNAGLQYTNNNLNFFNTDKIFRKYKLMRLNEKNEPEQIVLMTGYFSSAPNEFTVVHSDFKQIYDMMLEDPTIYLTPIWESYKYDVEFIYNEKSTTLTLESAKKYILDIGNTSDYIFNVGDVGSSNDTVDLSNFITHFTNVDAEIYSYYVGWANTNGILRYTAGQAGLTNLVPISKNSVFDGNRKLTSDKLTLQAFFTRRMTNKNGVIFKEGDHYYCDDTKLMLINISNNGFWTIDTAFG